MLAGKRPHLASRSLLLVRAIAHLHQRAGTRVPGQRHPPDGDAMPAMSRWCSWDTQLMQEYVLEDG